MVQETEITSLLVAWGNGDQHSLERLLPLVETELRGIARNFMHRESPGHLLQTTALVNEVYLRLINQKQIEWKNRAHFFGIAAHLMRQILLNYARDRVAQKRGGKNSYHVKIDEARFLSTEKSADLIALDEALKSLAVFDEVKSRIVELKCFGGLTAKEIAGITGLSVPTVNLYWRLAKAWLAKEMRR